MPENKAAWLTAPKSPTLEIKPAPYTPPRDDEIVIRNHAVSINPIDYILQDQGTSLAFTWLKYPLILGQDVSGEVVEVGANVQRFKPGDRVLGQALGHDERRNSPAENAFQLYTVLLADMACPIPETMTHEQACVLPLCLSTAACALFQQDQLALPLPLPPQPQPQPQPPAPTGKTLLIWGGSTSVGSNAIQLATAAGHKVFTTCSPRNFAYVRALGATQAFDYNSATVIPDLIRALQGEDMAGALSIGAGAADACFSVLQHCTGRKFVSMATFPVPSPPARGRFATLKTIWCFASWSVAAWFKSRWIGVGYNFVVGTSLAWDGVGRAIYGGFLPGALEEVRARGGYVAAPEPVVVGRGLEFLGEGLRVLREGVSARKVVVSL